MADEPELAATPAEDTTPVDPTTSLAHTPVEKSEEAEPEKVPETPEPVKAETEEKPPETEEADEGEEGKKKPTGSARAKRALTLARNEIENLARENEELRRRQQPVGDDPNARPGIDREPRETDFPGNWQAYDDAKQEWRIRKVHREERALDEQRRSESVRNEIFQERIDALKEGAEIARERIQDFDKVVAAAAGVKVLQPVVEEVLASEKSALLQYYLAKNPEKVRELNGMSRLELAREIGRLESRVHLPTAKQATEAKPPLAPIKGGAAPAFNPATASMEDYVARRKAGWNG